MKRSEFDCEDYRGVEWMTDDNGSVLRAQCHKETGATLIAPGFPQLDGLTEAESVRLVDEFAAQFGALFGTMRARLAEIRHV